MWDTKKLEDVCQINPIKSCVIEPNELVSILPMAAISEDGRILSHSVIRNNEVRPGLTPFKLNDILLAKITPCFENGKGTLVEGISSRYGYASTEFHVLRPNSRIHPRYLFYFTRSPRFKSKGIKSMTGSAGQKRVPSSFLKNLKIPLPPLHIQEQIADTLDKADALRRKDQELLKKYDELNQAIFYEMFGDPVRNEKGWEKSKLKELVYIDTQNVKPEDTVGRHYVGLENIEKESGTVTQSNEVELKSNKFLFDSSCILYGKLRPYLKKVATPNFDGVCSTDIFPIRCKGLEKEFAATILRSEHFTDYANSSSVGANLPRVNKDVILSYETICPPMRLQEDYSIKINQIKQLKSVVDKSKVAYEKMQSGLFKSFFS